MIAHKRPFYRGERILASGFYTYAAGGFHFFTEGLATSSGEKRINGGHQPPPSRASQAAGRGCWAGCGLRECNSLVATEVPTESGRFFVAV